MAHTEVESPNQGDTSPGQVTELLEQALRRPGVRDLMAVYEKCKPIEDAARPYLNAIGGRIVVSTSNASGPMVQRTP